MKQIITMLLMTGLFACNQQAHNNDVLQRRIDSLESKLADSYRPGFGEFMSSIQVHHNKLWFAGQNENWELADFEIHEIMEAIDDIQKYQAERKESEMVKMILPVLDSLNTSIERENPILFKSNFVLLTNTCNNCHRAVNFGFNVVKIPDRPPFSNQDFKHQDEQ